MSLERRAIFAAYKFHCSVILTSEITKGSEAVIRQIFYCPLCVNFERFQEFETLLIQKVEYSYFMWVRLHNKMEICREIFMKILEEKDLLVVYFTQIHG
jgi:late competence protein required for DNA uptake (superfamily II DNA/RNA helicase)